MRGDVSPNPNKPMKSKKPASNSRNALNIDDVESSLSKERKAAVSPPPSRRGYARGSNGPEYDDNTNTSNSNASTSTAPHAVHIEGDIELGLPVGPDPGGAAAGSKPKRPASRPGEKLSRATSVEKTGDKPVNRFKGKFPLQYALYAHFMSYGAALLCLALGAFSMAWTDAETYKCKIDEKLISSIYLLNDSGTCNATYVRPNGDTNYICCDTNSTSDLQGYLGIGIAYVLYAIFIFLYEDTTWGYGLWLPNDTFWFAQRISPIGLLHIVMGIAGLYNYATCLGGACLLTAGVVYQIAARRNEAGDGGREARAASARKDQAKRAGRSWGKCWAENLSWICTFNPAAFFRRIFNEDKLSSYVWVGIFVLGNLALFVWALDIWIELVEHTNNALLDGTLDISSTTRVSHYNRKAVRYGPISRYAPWAKGFGTCLNLQCCMLLLPVVKNILRKINNWGVSFHASQKKNDIFGRLFAHPLTRYIPLQKNIEFHKLCAGFIFIFSWAHLFFHLMNLLYSNNSTLAYFRIWQWDGTYLFSGAVTTYAMFVLYPAAVDDVRRSRFEIFFESHKYMFILFFTAMFHHGPNFFYWTVIPVLLYIYEKYLLTKRGQQPWTLIKVEWISPVMALYFRPVFKEHFVFKEGMYLYLNCPTISESEWHPFTISSAVDDLNNTTRIHLETGEEVVEVPRPKGLPAGTKWNKYCLASQDWQTMDTNDLLEKADTGFFDYVTLHIKVFGLEEPHPRTWTRKLKEFFESMSAGRKFPFYFFRRDQRGEIQMGRQYGPDGEKPILRIDGPHSAPAEHYVQYGTLMLIGAGIGLTPCVSILTALTKYRWRKNFNPELLHFYWIVRQNEIESFQWLVHSLTEISFELKKSRAANQIERRYYCEINIYVTAVEKEKLEVKPLSRAPKKRFVSAGGVQPTFTAEDLYAKLLNPTVESRGQVKKMKETHSENRLQDIWIWNGRPHWDEVFREMKEQRQHSDIGVCFCGSPAIGADLRTMCEKYSSAEEQCLFNLHKENF